MRLIDTNILVYAFDNSSKRQERAQEVLTYYLGTGEAVISLQSVVELYAARLISEKMLNSGSFKKINADAEAVSEALRLAGEKGLRRSEILDALLATTAKRNGIKKVLTENSKHFEGLGLEVETLETATLSEG